MRVMHVNVCASIGSTGKIISDISQVLKKNGHDVLICYGANEHLSSNEYYRFCTEFERGLNAVASRITGIMYGFYPSRSTKKLFYRIKLFNPDIVHLHCINGFTVDVFQLLRYLGGQGIKTVLTLHAEFMYTGTCSHSFDCDKWRTGCYDCSRARSISKSIFDKACFSWHKMSDAFASFKTENLIITSVSPWLKGRASSSPFLSRFRNEVVLNGLDTSIFRFKKVDINKYELLKDISAPICLFVTASFSVQTNDNKGGHYILRLADLNPHIIFVVIAFYTEIHKTDKENVVIWGRTRTQEELADLYNIAKVSVVLSKRETFSMVTAESLSCGTPVVGFQAGGPESIAIKDYTSFVEYNDIPSLSKEVNKFVNLDLDSATISNMARRQYSRERMTDSYMEVYNSLREE